MSAFIRIDRVTNAVRRLCDWRGTVKQQSTAHVFPLLALLEKGVNTLTPKVFTETDDRAFFDLYFKVSGSSEKPYFDPFSREFRIASHAHSNIATARKNTFKNRWKAASNPGGDKDSWLLSENFAAILAEKLFTKSGGIRRLNVLDLACWLFRSEEFPDGATAESIKERFEERFPLSQADFDQLFVFQHEPVENIFQAVKPDPAELDAAISSLAFEDAVIAGNEALHQSKDHQEQFVPLPEDDPILVEVKGLLSLGTSGIILRGAPGTGKSWYADRIAMSLTGGDRTRIFRVQFHPSYTYEDFFDGFMPSQEAKSGFEITGKVFRRAIEKSQETDGSVVLLIDEINRGNTAKIFGEALTYIEHGWRNVKFTPRLSSDEIFVPSNLIVLATMNPHDRSITPLDMALLRRFDQIDVPPSAETVCDFLEAAGMPAGHVGLISDWFNKLQAMLPFGIGHTFFLDISDVAKLGLVWRYRILPFCQSILEYEQPRLQAVINSFEALEIRLREIAQ